MTIEAVKEAIKRLIIRRYELDPRSPEVDQINAKLDKLYKIKEIHMQQQNIG